MRNFYLKNRKSYSALWPAKKQKRKKQRSYKRLSIF